MQVGLDLNRAGLKKVILLYFKVLKKKGLHILVLFYTCDVFQELFIDLPHHLIVVYSQPLPQPVYSIL